jgi:hypothetical protein
VPPLLLLRDEEEEEEHRSHENAAVVDDLALSLVVVSFLLRVVREDLHLFSVFFEITITVNAPSSSSPECNASSTTPNDDRYFFFLLFFFFPTAKHRRRAPRARFCPFGRSFAGV